MSEAKEASDALLGAGISAFDEGRYFEAHEALEDLWRLERDPELRILWQGLVQVAVGLTHLGRKNPTGARTLLGRGLDKLRSVRTRAGGLELAGFVAGIDGCLASIAVAPREGDPPFEWSKVPSLAAARSAAGRHDVSSET